MERIFKVNDCDWYMACCFESAVADAMRETGCDRDDYDESGEPMTLVEMWNAPYIFDINGDHNERTRFLWEWLRLSLGGKNERFTTLFATRRWEYWI